MMNVWPNMFFKLISLCMFDYLSYGYQKPWFLLPDLILILYSTTFTFIISVEQTALQDIVYYDVR